ncbi:protein FAM107B-like isoform X4 [Phyllopteryx taeniolatus]|uniref:protein FAM107B-like isoform X4 n=1 Tax=Phyllopteryx taeniolatus TaxID=161469 RepID=UPI002AD3C2D4|nr:protein FAM107B-like isoform X4 [Phyllopteryx taeniolatus]
MGASHGKKRAYDIAREPGDTDGTGSLRASSSAHACDPAPPPADCLTDRRDHRHDRRHRDRDDLIKPRKLLNPVKGSRSHQELHRELMTSCKRSDMRVESSKPELERVLECRRRDQLIKERKQEEDARRKISPLEAELRKRLQALEEMEAEQQKDERDNPTAPEFVKVKENLRRTSCVAGKGEQQV